MQVSMLRLTNPVVSIPTKGIFQKEEINIKERLVFNGDKFIVLIPYASMYSGEVRIICKDNTKFEDLGENNIEELSRIFKNLFKKIYKITI